MARANDRLDQLSAGDRQVSVTNGAKIDTREQIRRIAQIAECGDTTVLSELPGETRLAVLRELMRLRRKRLMSFLACVIAQDIRRSRQASKEV